MRAFVLAAGSLALTADALVLRSAIAPCVFHMPSARVPVITASGHQLGKKQSGSWADMERDLISGLGISDDGTTEASKSIAPEESV
jgi:hypothetical protein